MSGSLIRSDDPDFSKEDVGMNDMTVDVGGYVPVDTSPIAPPKTRAERVADWKRENQAAYESARKACCTCTPSRAEMLLGAPN